MKKNAFLTMFLVLLNFALWGLVNNMSDNLVPAFQRIFSMDQDRAVLVQVSFYGAYAVLAMFTSILVEEFSFRTGMLIGLGTYVIGALLYIPACIHQSFDFYFVGIFVVAGGCAILGASSNPCVLAIGDPKSAIRRLNFAQAINPVGSIVGIFLAQKVILAHLNPATVEERMAMDPEVLKGIIHNELVWICVPYVGLCLVMIAIWVYFFRHPLVTTVESGAEKGPLGPRIRHVASALAFDGEARKLINGFKFQHQLWLRDDFVDGLEAVARVRLKVEEIDLVLPMPSTFLHRLDRGYNPCDYLARALARRLKKPYSPRLLSRVNSPKRQRGLSEEERRMNVIGTFGVLRPRAIAGKTVMVVDDIMTTGSTLSECAAELKRAGAARGWCVTLARSHRS